MSQFCVIGLGRFGSAIAEELSKRKQQILAIDKDENLIKDISSFVTRAVVADSTDEKVLRRLNITSFDVVIIAIGELQDSILTALLLKDLKVKKIIAKALTIQHKKVLEKIGVEKVILPEREMGVSLVNKLVETKFFDQIEMSEEYSIIEISPPVKWQNKSLMEADIRKKFNVSVVGIRKKITKIDEQGKSQIKDHLIISPRPEEMIGKEDFLIIIGENKHLEKIRKL